jgi:hypothetical protein
MHQGETGPASKLMFVHQAITEARQREKPTVLLFSEGYTDKQKDAFIGVINNLGGRVVQVKTADEVVNYLNSKEEPSPQHGPWMRPANDPIKSLSIFSHGIPGVLAFGMDTKNAQTANLNESHVKKLDPKAFDKAADITSYACRQGLGNPNIDVRRGKNEDERVSESLAQKIANQIGVQGFQIENGLFGYIRE